jgi:hypothetical protein
MTTCLGLQKYPIPQLAVDGSIVLAYEREVPLLEIVMVGGLVREEEYSPHGASKNLAIGKVGEVCRRSFYRSSWI